MAKPRIFVSFDYEQDRQYKYLLEAWDANDEFDFVFSDATPREINSDNVGRVKAAITAKIKSATHTLVIVGKYANQLHPDHELIGFRNWINFEVYQSVASGNKIAAVKIDRNNESPEELQSVDASWAYGFTEENVIDALQLQRV